MKLHDKITLLKGLAVIFTAFYLYCGVSVIIMGHPQYLVSDSIMFGTPAVLCMIETRHLREELKQLNSKSPNLQIAI